MKKNSSKNKLLWYIILFVVSLFIIFFVGTKINPTTGKGSPILTTNWLKYIKKWLDLAWWVKLTYKVDLSKYEETYKNDPTQLTSVKKMALDIILKNIDKRISTLWVSDYSAYVQRYEDGEYIIVEIGGVNDIEAAKNLIWKTVELEFKLANREAETGGTWLQSRISLADSLLSSVLSGESMENIGTTKGSEDVYYNKYIDVSLEELPMIYSSNINGTPVIDAIRNASGWLYDWVIEGVYHVIPTQTATGYSQIELDGYTIARYLGEKTVDVTSLTSEDLYVYALNHNIQITDELSSEKAPEWLTYNEDKKAVIYGGSEILPWSAGYEVAVYQLADDQQQDVTVAALSAASSLYPSASGATLVLSGWKAVEDIKAYVPQFSFDAANKVTTYKELDSSYAVVVYQEKKADQTIYEQYKLSVENKEEGEKLIAALWKRTLYTFEDLFISKTLSWMPAKDPIKGHVLNGAFFKYASVTQSQTGQPVVSIQFDDQGKDIFCNITERYVGEQMAIFVWGKMMTNPSIREKICGGSAQIDGMFDIAGAKQLAEELNSWALPAPLLLSHQETISPTLWVNALNAALLAGLVWLIVIFLLMAAVYGLKRGIIALLWLIVFLVYLLAIMKVFGVVSSLSGIAAIILSIGMGVDANVLIYERTREELAAGKSMRTAIEEWYRRSRSSIRDGNVTTGIIGLLLFLVWVGVFKWFGTLMVINTLLILFVMTPVARELLHLFYNSKEK